MSEMRIDRARKRIAELEACLRECRMELERVAQYDEGGNGECHAMIDNIDIVLSNATAKPAKGE